MYILYLLLQIIYWKSTGIIPWDGFIDPRSHLVNFSFQSTRFKTSLIALIIQNLGMEGTLDFKYTSTQSFIYNNSDSFTLNLRGTVIKSWLVLTFNLIIPYFIFYHLGFKAIYWPLKKKNKKGAFSMKIFYILVILHKKT